MIVVDASAMVEALVGRDVDETLMDALAGEVAAPHILDVEVLSVLRGLVLGRELAERLSGVARSHHFEILIDRHETAPLADRMWDLRHQYTSYDASTLPWLRRCRRHCTPVTPSSTARATMQSSTSTDGRTELAREGQLRSSHFAAGREVTGPCSPTTPRAAHGQPTEEYDQLIMQCLQ